MDEMIFLVRETFSSDGLQMVPSEELVPVWAHLQSVTRAEWTDAGQKGLQPQLVAITPIVNYSGEQIVQRGEGTEAKRYGVYRTYVSDGSDVIELYLERKVGV